MLDENFSMIMELCVNKQTEKNLQICILCIFLDNFSPKEIVIIL